MNAFARRALCLAGFGLALGFLASSIGVPDVVTLQNGGSIHGKATTGRTAKSVKTVTTTTQSGTVVVVEQADVKRIQHAAEPKANSSVRPKFTAAENAWFDRIHKLSKQAECDDPDRRGRAIRDLRAVKDPDAIPALAQYLRMNGVETARLLYVRILGDIPGPKSAVGLVEEALFDSSATVRDTALAAAKEKPPEFVRAYFGQALRFPNRNVVCRAASVLATAGDKDNVPYLIDALYSKTVDVVLRPTCCMTRINYLVMRNPGSRGYGVYGGGYVDGPEAVAVPRIVQNPEVREALERITRRSFGYNTDAWRRWWAAEQLAEANASRRLPDRPISRPTVPQPPAPQQ